MCKSLTILITLFFLHSSLFSQSRYTVTAKLKYNDGPVTGATVLLMNPDSAVVRSAISNEEGLFLFTDLDTGKYILTISHTSYQPGFVSVLLEGAMLTRNIGDIILEKSVGLLQEVTIRAERPVIEYKNDRLVLNISEKMQKISPTSFNLLNKAPGVMLGRDNKIQIDGQSNIMITVNGRQRFSSVEEAIQFLQNTPAEMISSIEVIKHPSAKYDQSAAGGILNIVLKKDETQGVRCFAKTYFNSGTYNRYGDGLSVNIRKKRMNLYAMYDYSHDTEYEKEKGSQTFSDYAFDQDYELIKKPGTHNLRAGADFTLKNNHIIGLLTNILRTAEDNNRFTNTSYHPVSAVIDSIITLHEASKVKNNRSFFNINYTGAFGKSKENSINIDASYIKDDLSRESYFVHKYYDKYYSSLHPDFTLFANLPSLVELKVFRAEYSRNLKNDMKLEAGIKTSFSKTDNNVSYDTVINQVFIRDTSLSHHHAYQENVTGLYATMSRFTEKMGWIIGLRYELADVNGKTIGQSSIKRTFNGLLPNLMYRHAFDEKNSVTVNFIRILARPDFIKLNPFIQYLNQNFYYQGNPDLKQFSIYISSLNYTYKSYSFTLRYDYTANYIPQELFVRSGTSLVTKATYANAADLHGFQLSIAVPFDKLKWWSSNNNINVFHGTVKPRDPSYTNLDYTNTEANFSSSNTFTLPKKFYGELNFSFSTRSRNNQVVYKGNHSLDLRLTRSILKNRLKLSVTYDDITYGAVTRGYKLYNGIRNDYSTKYDTRRFGISASYRFGSATIASSRQRNVGTEDEESRIKKKFK